MPVQSRAQTKQTHILKAATELFMERGYDAVSLDDIVERVGGSKTTLYSYYGGKEGLFEAMVRRLCEEKLTPLTQLDLGSLEPKAGLTKIGTFFLTLVSEPLGRGLYRMMIAEAERFPEIASIFYHAGPEALVASLAKTFAVWQKKGWLRPGSPETFAVQFIGIMLGNFSAKSLLVVSYVVTEKEIKEWVVRGVTTFLEGAGLHH